MPLPHRAAYNLLDNIDNKFHMRNTKSLVLRVNASFFAYTFSTFVTSFYACVIYSYLDFPNVDWLYQFVVPKFDCPCVSCVDRYLYSGAGAGGVSCGLF